MRKIISLIFLLMLISSCANSRYLLTDSGKEKKFLIETINEMNKKGLITKRPILVIDGIPHRFNKELKENKLILSKNNIDNIKLLKKDVGIKIYGEFGEVGVLLITTKSSLKKEKENKT